MEDDEEDEEGRGVIVECVDDTLARDGDDVDDDTMDMEFRRDT